MRRRLVNLFKPTYLDDNEKIDFNRWLAMPNRGYCFASPNSRGRAMVLDIISRDDFIRGVVVGTAKSCAGSRIDKGFKDRLTRTKTSSYAGGGC